MNWIAADCSKINFESRYFLLEAEEFYSLVSNDPNNIENAKMSYIKAIASATKYRSISDEAYGCELFGYFLLEQQDDSCLRYFVTAQQKFNEWGAFKKARAMDDIIRNLSDHSSPNDVSRRTSMVSPQSCSEEKVDRDNSVSPPLNMRGGGGSLVLLSPNAEGWCIPAKGELPPLHLDEFATGPHSEEKEDLLSTFD